MDNLRSARVVVIGGTRGIGLAVVRQLAEAEARVVVGARRVYGVAALEELYKMGLWVRAESCDVTDPMSVDAFMSQATDMLGGLDILVNCATATERQDSEQGWTRSLQTDLLGGVRLLRSALPHLKESQRAAVVNLSSISAQGARTEALPYGAAKAAVEQYTAAAARLHARDRIRINCVAPGSTDFVGGIWDWKRQHDPDIYASTREAIPLGGFAQPEDIAQAVVFLASPRARWITGQCLVVDGGQLAAGVV